MNQSTLIIIVPAVLALAGTIYATWSSRRSSDLAGKIEEVKDAADNKAESARLIMEGNTRLIDDLTEDRKLLRSEQLEDRKQINQLRSKLDTCLTEKTKESIAFEKRIAKLEGLVEATEAQLHSVREFQAGGDPDRRVDEKPA